MTLEILGRCFTAEPKSPFVIVKWKKKVYSILKII